MPVLFEIITRRFLLTAAFSDEVLITSLNENERGRGERELYFTIFMWFHVHPFFF